MKAIFLETDRLLLRKFQESDFADFCTLVMDPERNRMMGNDDVSSVEDARALFDWFLHKEKRAYALVLKASGKVVGNLTVYDEPPEEIRTRAELAGKKGRSLSFSLSPEYRRQGLMFEAVQAVIDHLFTAENVEYINDGFFDFNRSSQALHEKLGFQELTTQRFSLEEGGEELTGIETVLWRK